MLNLQLINDKHELNDEDIMRQLHNARWSFYNGEIIECRDTLAEIVAAIDEFTEWEEKRNA